MRLTKRQRLIWITCAIAALFLLASAGIAWHQHVRAPEYRPGQQVEGLTDDLGRSLPPDHPRLTFTDVTRAAGIEFQHFGATRTSQIPEDMGSGVAWRDFDGDGWEDLAVANEVGPLDMPESERLKRPPSLTLYHNNHDGTFTDVTARSGIAFRGLGMGVYWADYDNDGHPDLLITAYGHCVLYHNNGDGTFTDVSTRSGVGIPEGFWTGAAWGDYDRDGYLDLYVTGYVKYTKDVGNAKGKYDLENPASINPVTFAPERNLLFHNNGNGTFTEVALKAGVLDTTGRSLGAAWVDLDEDGWPDLYVANDESPNALYRNLHDGKFEDISQKAGVLEYRSSMGIAVGDWNGDGYQDMYLTHWLAEGNALYDNELANAGPRRKGGRAPLAFMDEADRYGLGQISLDYVGFSTSFEDFDDDGKLDLFVVNGSTLQQRDAPTQLVAMNSKVFWDRDGAEGFYDLSPVAGDYFRRKYVGRGAAFADYDNDGDVDAFIVNFDGPAVLLRNDGGNRGHWLQVKLQGTKSNRDAIGAEVRVFAGGRAQVRQIGAQAPYLSQNSLVETFGLGAQTGVDSVDIRWPSGLRQHLASSAANQRLTIVEGAAAATQTSATAPSPAESDATAGRAPQSAAASSGTLDRQRVLSFWTILRQATSLRIAGQTAAASDAYARALALDPTHEDALYYFGTTRFDLGDFAGAARAWRRLVAIDPRSGRAHSQLGALFLCLDPGAPFDVDSAEVHLRVADALYSEQIGPRLHLGEAALFRGDRRTARERIENVLRTDWQNAQALFYEGYLAWAAGDEAAARAAYGKAAAAPPPSAPTGGASIEGDTKTGAPAGQRAVAHCGALGAASAGIRAADASRTIDGRYRQLDALLRSHRHRRGERAGSAGSAARN